MWLSITGNKISAHGKTKLAYSISKWCSSTTITFIIDNRDKYIDKSFKVEICLWNLWKLLVWLLRSIISAWLPFIDTWLSITCKKSKLANNFSMQTFHLWLSHVIDNCLTSRSARYANYICSSDASRSSEADPACCVLCPPTVRLSVCPFVRLSVRLSACPSVRLVPRCVA